MCGKYWKHILASLKFDVLKLEKCIRNKRFSFDFFPFPTDERGKKKNKQKKNRVRRKIALLINNMTLFAIKKPKWELGVEANL